MSFVLLLSAFSSAPGQDETSEPTLHNFLGLNGHTVQFKPELYAPVTRLVRDYHGLKWDVYRYREKEGDRMALAAWSPTGTNRETEHDLSVSEGKKLIRAERMPLSGEAENQVSIKRNGNRLSFKLTESPVYLLFE